MNRLGTTGRWVFALGIAAIGAVSLLFGQYVSALQPLPEDLPGRAAIAFAGGASLLLCGAGLAFAKTARAAALALAFLLLGACLAIHLPILLAGVRNGTSWVRLFEPLALAGAALIVAASVRATAASARTIAIGRWLFAVSLPVFAATHFIYAEFVASLIPAWIPARLFWAYFTGAAHLFAGLAIMSNVLARLAATLAGAMYGSWAVILHLPRVMADTGNQGEITSLFMAVALCGAAWVIAGSAGEREAVWPARSNA